MATTRPIQSVYFDEGEGFHYIKPVGRGQDGTVALVSTGPGGKRVARKEASRHQPITNKNKKWYLEAERPLRPGHTGEDAMGEDLSQPPKEARISEQLASVDGVCKVRGWCRHIDTVNKSVVTSTYMDYYNGGSVAELYRDTMPMNEYWVSHVLLSMTDTLIRTHRAGITHGDTHGGNWFWEHLVRPDGDDQINVVLGDFQRSRTREQCGDLQQWFEYCRLDYVWLSEVCVGLLDLPFTHVTHGGSNTSMVPYKEGFPCTQFFWTLLRNLRDLTNKDSDNDPIQQVETWRQGLEAYHDELMPVPWPEPKESLEDDDEDFDEWFMPLEEALELFSNRPVQQPKFWKIANITDTLTGDCELSKMPEEFRKGPQYMDTYTRLQDFYLN